MASKYIDEFLDRLIIIQENKEEFLAMDSPAFFFKDGSVVFKSGENTLALVLQDSYTQDIIWEEFPYSF